MICFICFGLSLGTLFNAPTAAAATLSSPGQQTKPGDDKTLLLYPNPSTGIVHLTINNLQGKKVQLSVLNVIGSVMYRETLTEMNDRYTKMLDLTKFANGLYYVRLEANNTSQMCKLVIR
ncbi:hypothetical protein BEN47_05015 [Hymenobacter lapidarius]|uniref:Secretion system C-terminal sorting domain-containing protein n=1 Tax=Hymenobacter lapidarius TaxID=1908237 RepID=A0A1G1STN7_9BACT|nr:hypothetical protein BEN47_05015 [Hymenobacter lapidarius]